MGPTGSAISSSGVSGSTGSPAILGAAPNKTPAAIQANAASVEPKKTEGPKHV